MPGHVPDPDPRAAARLSTLSLRQAPRWVQVLAGATLALVAAYTVSVLPGMPGRPGTIPLWETWVRSAAYAGAAALCVRPRPPRHGGAPRVARAVRRAVVLHGRAMSASASSTRDGAVPYVSFADALWLGFYPLAYVALVLLVRGRARHFHRSTWLDGLVAGLAAAAFSAAIAYDVLISHAGGRAARRRGQPRLPDRATCC